MDKKKRLSLATATALAGGFILAIVIIRLLFLGKAENPEEYGLGKQSTAYFPKIDGHPIHVDSFAGIPAMQSYALKEAGQRKITLWLGNSQLHGINQFSNGDRNCVDYLFLDKIGSHFVIGYSIPNANLQEHYVAFKYLLTQLPVKQLILPVFFDDTRETGIRPDLLRVPIKEAMASDMDSSSFGVSLKSQFEATGGEASGKDDQDMKALHSTTQEVVEQKLNKDLASVSEIWDERANIRSAVIYSYIYRLRNSMLGINPSTKRKKIPARYQDNLQAFINLLVTARKSQVDVLVYIPPIRGDVEQPYLQPEYEAFKEEIRKLCQDYGARFYNAENIVPPQYWGTKPATTMDGNAGEIDFMHFKAQAHRILVDSLKNKIN